VLLRDRGELQVLFDELAAELDRVEASADIVMVGGSWMLWHSKRSATKDVDSARRFDFDLSETIGRIGARHDLASDWLNDAAAAFWPVNASYDACEDVYHTRKLRVRTPDADVIFIMKLYRALPQDREDMVDLWPLCSFASADEAARAFHDGYPHAAEDEYLADFIRDVASDSALSSQ
jgi:hypothetical protein